MSGGSLAKGILFGLGAGYLASKFAPQFPNELVGGAVAGLTSGGNLMNRLAAAGIVAGTSDILNAKVEGVIGGVMPGTQVASSGGW